MKEKYNQTAALVFEGTRNPTPNKRTVFSGFFESTPFHDIMAFGDGETGPEGVMYIYVKRLGGKDTT